MVFPGSAFVSLGFASSTSSNDQWAYFGTRGTGNGTVPVIKTSVRGATGGAVDVPTAATFGEWHVFRIAWTAGSLAFFVDGALVDERTGTNLTLPQRVGFYKSDGSGLPLARRLGSRDPVRGLGRPYTSPVLDAGTAAAPWTTLAWSGTAPGGTTVAFETRTGGTPRPAAAGPPGRRPPAAPSRARPAATRSTA